MSAPVVRLEADAGVATIVLDAPPANALTVAVLDALATVLAAPALERADVVVVRSALPRFFAAGADLKLMATLDRGGFAAYLAELRGTLDALEALPQPTIAAVGGLALGGGLELALACTMRVVAPGAGLGLPEVRLGLLPGAGGTQRLPRLIGASSASDLLLTGRTVGGEEAHRIGLADRIADDADAGAAALAREIAGQRGAATRAIGRCVRADPATGMRTELDELLALFDSDDGRAAVRAFVTRSARER